jgi:hypothetical protein
MRCPVWSKSSVHYPKLGTAITTNPPELTLHGTICGSKPEFTLEAIIAQARPDVSSTERAHVLSFMLKGFSYDPQDRITAAQLLYNASFQAVMGVYGA